jgi:hypothetical protein
METKILVIDLPASVPADEASTILSEPLTRGYYLKSATTTGEPMRVVYSTYVEAKDGECDEELRAMELVVTHRRETATRIVQLLCKQGIYRGTTWVNKTRDEL